MVPDLRQATLYTKVSKMELKKRVLKLIIFILAFVVVWTLMQTVLAYDWDKTEHMKARYQSYANAEEGEWDVLWIGSSNINAAICPALMWHNNGITGFNLGTANNISLLAYYQLLYMLEVNEPKLVVMDLSGLSVLKNPDEYFNAYESVYRKVIDTMPDYSIKLEMTRDVCARYETLDMASFFLPLLRYHDRWEDISKEDINAKFTEDSYNEFRKGAHYNSKIMPQDWPEDVFTYGDEIIQLYDEYYQKMIDLCKSRGIEVLVMLSPKLDQRFADYEGAKVIAERNNLNFISFTTEAVFEEIGFDAKTDFYDPAHLNILGQHKFSKYMGDYIMETFGLTDHKNDERYADWDGWYDEYIGKFNSQKDNMTIIEVVDDVEE